MKLSDPRLKASLERAYSDFRTSFHRERDPIRFAYEYSNPRDQEIVCFLASLISYGKVQSILPNVRRILSALGEKPFEGLLSGEEPRNYSGFIHRWTKEEDIRIIVYWLQRLLQEYGSIEAAFPKRESMREAQSEFIRVFTKPKLPTSLRNIAESRKRNLAYLLPDPMRGSACKRLNMFLRWMVRPADGIDLGLWKAVAPAQLLLPIDTHILKTLRKLKWTRSNTANWKVAEESTNKLKHFCPEDPVRYDFSLCHLSMSGRSLSEYYEELE